MRSALIVDDHPVVLRACRAILSDIGLQDIHEATTVVQGFRDFIKHKPDIVVVDLSFQGDDLGGLSLIRHISAANRHTPILAFSMHADPAIVSRALACGAMGYVIKDSPASELVTACSQLLDGKPHLSQRIAVQVMDANGAPKQIGNLSVREMRILSLLGRGDNYAVIATKLGFSYKTVFNVASEIRRKLEIETLAELVRFAIANDPYEGLDPEAAGSSERRLRRDAIGRRPSRQPRAAAPG